MLVRFKTNLGSIDAAAIGVDYKECLLGMERDISDAPVVKTKEGVISAAQWLVTRGIAEKCERAANKTAVIAK